MAIKNEVNKLKETQVIEDRIQIKMRELAISELKKTGDLPQDFIDKPIIK